MTGSIRSFLETIMPGPNRHTEGLIDFLDVVASTTATNGEIRANIGNASTGVGVDRSVPFWGIDGFLSRPADPSNGAAQYLYFCDGNQRYGIGSRDRRFYDGLETIDVGDRMIYAPSGIRIRLDDSEEAIEMNIPGGTQQYLGSDLAFTSIASGPKIELDLSTVDVTKLGTAESVALYAVIQTYLTTQHAWIVAAQPALWAWLLAFEPNPAGPLKAALLAAFTAEGIAYTNASNPLLASSAVLRASPT